MSQIEKRPFQLPITYIDHNELSQSLIDDLELTAFKDNKDSGFYDKILTPDTSYGKYMAKEWAQYYTKDQSFLTQSQYLYKHYDASMNIYDKEKLENIESIWTDIKSNESFINKFHYVEYGICETVK